MEHCSNCNKISKSTNLLFINNNQHNLCNDCLYAFLIKNNADNCWSPVAMRFGDFDGDVKCKDC